jgi:multiple sugar transport system permease protein
MTTETATAVRVQQTKRAGGRRPARSALQRERGRIGLVMILPAVILVVAVLGIPIGEAVYHSMTQWNGIQSTWIGPSAYTHTFSDPTFWRVMENNALLLLAIPFAVLIPLAIAFLLNERVLGWKVFRTIYFMPTAISWVVIGMVAERFFARDGSLNSILSGLGLGFIHTDLLSNEHQALLAVGMTFVWSMVGTNTIIFLTGIATLDPSLAEAARVDGTNAWQRLIHITLPQLRRFILFASVLTMISAFTALFSLIFVMTGGGPGYGTTTLEFFVYQNAFGQANFGYGALLGVILFVIMAVVGLVQLVLLRTED